MQAKRFNSGKPELSRVLEFGPALASIARVMASSDAKYGRYNWQQGMNHVSLMDSLLRHCTAWMNGDDIDPETGEHHIAHAVCNGLMLLWNVAMGRGTDGRPMASSGALVDAHRAEPSPAGAASMMGVAMSVPTPRPARDGEAPVRSVREADEPPEVRGL